MISDLRLSQDLQWGKTQRHEPYDLLQMIPTIDPEAMISAPLKTKDEVKRKVYVSK